MIFATRSDSALVRVELKRPKEPIDQSCPAGALYLYYDGTPVARFTDQGTITLLCVDEGIQDKLGAKGVKFASGNIVVNDGL